MKKKDLALLASLSVFVCGVGYLLLTANRPIKKKLSEKPSTAVPDESRIRNVMHKAKEHAVVESASSESLG